MKKTLFIFIIFIPGLLIGQIKTSDKDTIFSKYLSKLDTVALPIKILNKYVDIVYGGDIFRNKFLDEEYFNLLNIENGKNIYEYTANHYFNIDTFYNFYLVSYTQLNMNNMAYKYFITTIDKLTLEKISDFVVYSTGEIFSFSTINEDLTIELKTEKRLERLLLDDLDIYDKILVTNYKYIIEETGKIKLLEKQVEGNFDAKMIGRDEGIDDFYIYPVELPKK